jgi:hypothetical protein
VAAVVESRNVGGMKLWKKRAAGRVRRRPAWIANQQGRKPESRITIREGRKREKKGKKEECSCNMLVINDL